MLNYSDLVFVLTFQQLVVVLDYRIYLLILLLQGLRMVARSLKDITVA